MQASRLAGPAELEVIRQAMRRELAAHQAEDGLIVPMPAMLGVGEKGQ